MNNLKSKRDMFGVAAFVCGCLVGLFAVKIFKYIDTVTSTEIAICILSTIGVMTCGTLANEANDELKKK